MSVSVLKKMIICSTSSLLICIILWVFFDRVQKIYEVINLDKIFMIHPLLWHPIKFLPTFNSNAVSSKLYFSVVFSCLYILLQCLQTFLFISVFLYQVLLLCKALLLIFHIQKFHISLAFTSVEKWPLDLHAGFNNASKLYYASIFF